MYSQAMQKIRYQATSSNRIRAWRDSNTSKLESRRDGAEIYQQNYRVVDHPEYPWGFTTSPNCNSSRLSAFVSQAARYLTAEFSKILPFSMPSHVIYRLSLNARSTSAFPSSLVGVTLPGINLTAGSVNDFALARIPPSF